MFKCEYSVSSVFTWICFTTHSFPAFFIPNDVCTWVCPLPSLVCQLNVFMVDISDSSITSGSLLLYLYHIGSPFISTYYGYSNDLQEWCGVPERSVMDSEWYSQRQYYIVRIYWSVFVCSAIYLIILNFY